MYLSGILIKHGPVSLVQVVIRVCPFVALYHHSLSCHGRTPGFFIVARNLTPLDSFAGVPATSGRGWSRARESRRGRRLFVRHLVAGMALLLGTLIRQLRIDLALLQGLLILLDKEIIPHRI